MKKTKTPLRKCLACNQQKEKNELIRVVKNKDGDIFLDFNGKANGRGAYICKDIVCLDKIAKKDGLSRTFKTKVPEEIYTKLRKELNHE